MTHSFTVITWFTHFGVQLPNRLSQNVYASAKRFRAFFFFFGEQGVHDLISISPCSAKELKSRWERLYCKISSLKKKKKSCTWEPNSRPSVDRCDSLASLNPVLLWAGSGSAFSLSIEEGWGPHILPRSHIPRAWGCRLEIGAPGCWVGTAPFQSQPFRVSHVF